VGRRGDILLGIGGVPPDDAEAAYAWERRLHWVMIGVALLSLPAFFLEEFAGQRDLRPLARILDWLILVAFGTELVLMVSLVRQKLRYLLHNWLDVVIVAFSLASVFGTESEWVALARLSLAGALVARAAGGSRSLFRRGYLVTKSEGVEALDRIPLLRFQRRAGVSSSGSRRSTCGPARRRRIPPATAVARPDGYGRGARGSARRRRRRRRCA
jgi:hypothetical protein